MRRSVQERNCDSTNRAHTATRCSQLSSTSRSFLGWRTSESVSINGRLGCSDVPRDEATTLFRIALVCSIQAMMAEEPTALLETPCSLHQAMIAGGMLFSVRLFIGSPASASHHPSVIMLCVFTWLVSWTIRYSCDPSVHVSRTHQLGKACLPCILITRKE